MFAALSQMKQNVHQNGMTEGKYRNCVNNFFPILNQWFLYFVYFSGFYIKWNIQALRKIFASAVLDSFIVDYSRNFYIDMPYFLGKHGQIIRVIHEKVLRSVFISIIFHYFILYLFDLNPRSNIITRIFICIELIL